MKNLLSIAILLLVFMACTPKNKTTKTLEEPIYTIIGTWKLVYGEVKENDSLTVRDVSKVEFIKIINKTHFAYFNQGYQEPRNFYGAGGTYILKGATYTEKLTYTAWEDYRDQSFPFTIEIKKDSLIQYGIEEVKEKGIKRYVLEKYVRVP